MLLRSIFLKTIRDARLGLFWWSIGLSAMTLVNVLYYPSIKELSDFNKLLEGNDAIKAFTGNITSFTTPEGFLDSQIFFLLGPLLFIVYAVTVGSGALAGEEGRKTLPMLVSQPRSRTRILLEKYAAMLATTLLLFGVFFVITWGGIVAVAMQISVWKVLGASAAMVLLGIFFGSLAFLLGAATGKRGLAVGVSSALAVAAYLLNALAPLVKSLKDYQGFSPFDWYIGNDPIMNGLRLADMALLIGGSALFVALAVVLFRRRDIAT